VPPGSTNESSGWQRGVERVDLALQPLDLRVGDAQLAVARIARPAQIGAEVEQVVLDAGQHRIDVAIAGRRVQPRDPDRRVGLVDRAVGLDAQRVLGDPAAVAQRGLAGVAAARVDAGQPDHVSGDTAS
jgi:hypothetical protein